MLAAPCSLLLIVAIGAIVGDYRFRSNAKPPTVDLKMLPPDEIDVLLTARRKALTCLRARGVVSYRDFTGFDNTPLDLLPD